MAGITKACGLYLCSSKPPKLACGMEESKSSTIKPSLLINRPLFFFVLLPPPPPPLLRPLPPLPSIDDERHNCQAFPAHVWMHSLWKVIRQEQPSASASQNSHRRKVRNIFFLYMLIVSSPSSRLFTVSRDFICSYCNRGFSQPHHLESHINSQQYVLGLTELRLHYTDTSSSPAFT